jgi:hypothetical protein
MVTIGIKTPYRFLPVNAIMADQAFGMIELLQGCDGFRIWETHLKGEALM